VLLGLLTGFTVDGLAAPLLGVGAHLVGLIGGIFLVAAGLLWPRLALNRIGSAAGSWMAAAGLYGTWAVYLLAGAWGAGGMFPLAGRGARGSVIQEGIIMGAMMAIALSLIGTCALMLWGLRGRPGRDGTAPTEP
jgi:hypothetical protein